MGDLVRLDVGIYGRYIVYINVLARVYKLITGWLWLLLITCLTLGYMEHMIESMAANGLIKLTYDWGASDLVASMAFEDGCCWYDFSGFNRLLSQTCGELTKECDLT